MTDLKKICESCGKLIPLKYATNGKYLHSCQPKRFCSIACALVWRKAGWYQQATGGVNPHYRADVADRICGTCGKTFRASPARILTGGGKFCSKACWLIFKKQKFHPCETCKAPVALWRRFCSKRCMGIGFRGSNNPFKGHHSEKTLHLLISKLHSKPNGAESSLESILVEDLRLPFKYVGDGSVIVGGLNPDYVSTDDSKLIIELFGKGFHSVGKLKKVIPIRQTEAGRRAVYEQFGFSMLVVWHTELRKEEILKAKILAFCRSGGELKHGKI